MEVKIHLCFAFFPTEVTELSGPAVLLILSQFWPSRVQTETSLFVNWAAGRQAAK